MIHCCDTFPRAPNDSPRTPFSFAGCGAKFFVCVVSATFQGMGLLDRQRMVNDALKEEMNSIHALQMKTWTPAQYEKKKGTLA